MIVENIFSIFNILMITNLSIKCLRVILERVFSIANTLNDKKLQVLKILKALFKITTKRALKI